MQGIYEHERDSDKLPSCWRVSNDVCLSHFHSSIEFVYVIEGELKVTLNGIPYIIKKTSCLLYPAIRYTIMRQNHFPM